MFWTRFWKPSPTEKAAARPQPTARRWLKRLAAALALAPPLVAAYLAITIARYGQTDRARPAAVIIVLGGGEVGTQRRAQHAAALYEAGLAPVLLCTGGIPAGDAPSEAAYCADILRQHGVPPTAIMLEPTSRSTAENARETAAIMAAHGWADAVLVSDDFHLWRARWLFEKHGLRVYPSPAQTTTGPLPRGEKAYSLLREIAAWSVQALTYDGD